MLLKAAAVVARRIVCASSIAGLPPAPGGTGVPFTLPVRSAGCPIGTFEEVDA
ncbi:hypothetical protein [Saccharopolyspora karakumensis]|uniref:hypothetical protein n=1 Tax=Saccharopolyspora karakumensis TaxID=2530386 RepID=UPI001A9D22B8|nr:hypothetical protein [Saccharopolyspora karakumensis]